MPTNVIVNGTFDQDPGDAGFGWSGVGLETTYSEGTYQGNGSSNSVAEMNGNANSITVMEQTFNISNPLTTQLTLDAAIRNSNRSVVDEDGFQVEISDAAGTVIFSTVVFPQSTTFEAYSFDVTFPASGDYTITFTQEGGVGDSYGALVDDIAMMVCLTEGSRIATPDGEIAIEDLRPGMTVACESGPQTVRWIGHKTLKPADLSANPKLAPVLIKAGALGPDTPSCDMRVSRQHRMLIRSTIAERMFGRRDVLVPAIRLTCLPGITVEDAAAEVTYYHVLFDAHEIICADGALTESLFLGDTAMGALSDDALAEVRALFPDLDQPHSPAVPIPERARQIRLIARHGKNGRAVQSV